MGKLVVFQRLSFTPNYAAGKGKKKPHTMSQKIKVQTYHEVWRQQEQNGSFPAVPSPGLFAHGALPVVSLCKDTLLSLQRSSGSHLGVGKIKHKNQTRKENASRQIVRQKANGHIRTSGNQNLPQLWHRFF